MMVELTTPGSGGKLLNAPSRNTVLVPLDRGPIVNDYKAHFPLQMAYECFDLT